jgi:hypothetical protein
MGWTMFKIMVKLYYDLRGYNGDDFFVGLADDELERINKKPSPFHRYRRR